jgi:hypothetical protein
LLLLMFHKVNLDTMIMNAGLIMQMSNREDPIFGKKTQNGEFSIEIMKEMGLLLFKVSIMKNCNSAITIICVGSSLKMQETGGFKIQPG